MAESRQRPHILLQGALREESYSVPPGRGNPGSLPERDRASHASKLLGQLKLAEQGALDRAHEQAGAWGLPAKQGLHLEVESEPSFRLALERLEDRRQGIQVVSVREEVRGEGEEKETVTLATVYLPEGTLGSLEKKLQGYQSRNTRKSKKPLNEPFAAPIAELRLAYLRSFWTDEPDLFPKRGDSLWWEVWLRSPDQVLLEDFLRVGRRLGLRLRDESLAFVDTRVLLAHGSTEQFAASVDLLDSLAELRRAKEVPSFFMELPRREAGAWVDDLVRRSESAGPNAPRLCIHDTGVNAGHPLLRASLSSLDCHAVDPQWQVHDHQGHGTGMGGVALYGDLAAALAGSLPIPLPARLESVKILPPPPQVNEPEIYGRISEQAVARVEIEAPSVLRTHLMAVTATDGRDRGKPSSWSAALDRLAFGEGDVPRLWVQSAGNAQREAFGQHPAHLETEEIHDPGQAWNVLTVGACTERWQIEEEDFQGWQAVARPGELAPSTSTSILWDARWPLKPDVVEEGGNAARSSSGEVDLPDSLSLLTTYYRPEERLLTTFGDTSAAGALVARMAPYLWDRYPQLWPETIRALVVHSAQWTGAMTDRYGPFRTKGDYQRLIRHCGFGVPSLERALWSASNRLNLIAQESIQPFGKKVREDGFTSINLHQIHFYSLPWPVQQLRELGSTEVELRVTLSYFIEPNPSERGYRNRHRYASHGLRFDVRGANERLSEFRKRLNLAARAEGEASPGTGDSLGWLVGSDNRHKGSLHHDIWRGTAADLANRQDLAVYPVTGWWKENPRHGRWQRRTRYSLVVSIHSPQIEIDLYTPVLNQIGTAIEV